MAGAARVRRKTLNQEPTAVVLTWHRTLGGRLLHALLPPASATTAPTPRSGHALCGAYLDLNRALRNPRNQADGTVAPGDAGRARCTRCACTQEQLQNLQEAGAGALVWAASQYGRSRHAYHRPENITTAQPAWRPFALPEISGLCGMTFIPPSYARWSSYPTAPAA